MQRTMNKHTAQILDVNLETMTAEVKQTITEMDSESHDKFVKRITKKHEGATIKATTEEVLTLVRDDVWTAIAVAKDSLTDEEFKAHFDRILEAVKAISNTEETVS